MVDRFPDGTPRLGPNDTGSVGGNTNGYATRRVDGWSNQDTPSLGWIPNSPVNPAGGNYEAIGPGSARWASRSAARTLGQARTKR
jgi:hypothetical protein